MPDFLQPRNFGGISHLEAAGAIAGFTLLLLAWPLNNIAWASNTSTSLGFAVLGLTIGSIFKDWRWRRVFTKAGLDPNVKVYANRGAYGRIIHHISRADQVDFMGISLAYTIEYMRDSGRDFFGRVEHVRILLPKTQEICDARDRAQGSPVGSLWRQLNDMRTTINRLLTDFPTQVEVRYFNLQPYLALTRVDHRLWISPYITKSGNSSPVLAIDRIKSPALYNTMVDHFEKIWDYSRENTKTIEEHA